MRSFSKAYGLAGIRLGYGLASEELIGYLYRVRPPFDASVPAQAAGLGALQDEAFYRRTLKLCRKEKDFFYRELETLGLPYIRSCTNFILVDLGARCQELSRTLLERGLIVRFGFDGVLSTYIRIPPGTRRQNLRLIRALQEVWK